MSSKLSPYGYWQSQNTVPAFAKSDICDVVEQVRAPMFLVQDPSTHAIGLGLGGETVSIDQVNGGHRWPLLAVLPPLYPEWLGDRSFAEVHNTRFPYVSGAMANGIATTDIVIAMGRAGFLGFFGAAGLSRDRVEAAVALLKQELGDAHPWGCNLIHSPAEPALEEAVADLYIREGVKRVSAAAYMSLTPAIVRFALSGIHQDASGQIQRVRHVFAKISRP